MVAMTPPCADCGGERTYVRSRYEIAYPLGTLIAEEVPSLRCEACGQSEPAAHARPPVDAVLAVTQEVTAVARKDFTEVPLHPPAGPPGT